jgi:hypothetical protein
VCFPTLKRSQPLSEGSLRVLAVSIAHYAILCRENLLKRAASNQDEACSGCLVLVGSLSSSLLLYWLFLRLFLDLFLLVLLGMCCAALTHLTPFPPSRILYRMQVHCQVGQGRKSHHPLANPHDFAGGTALSGSLPPK